MKKINVFFVMVGRGTILYSLVTPPLGIMYLAAYLRTKFDINIKLVNQRLDNLSNDDIIRQIQNFNSDIICLSYLTPAAHMIPYLTKNLKSALPDSLIIIGGPHVSSFTEDSLLDNHADIAVPGEGEIALEKIIQRYLSGESYSDVAGIYIRDAKNNIIQTGGTVEIIKDIDSLPFPAYDLINITKYWNKSSMTAVPNRRYASLFSSRGCPYGCTYCHQIFGKKFRMHSAKRIIAEIQYLQKHYKIDEVEFYDDIFNLDHERLEEFYNLMIKNDIKLKLAFPNGVRTDIFKEAEIKALKEIGLHYASFALESGSPRIQKLIGKNLNIPKYLENVAIAAQCGIFSNGFVMLGFPTETEEEIKQTIEVVCSSKLHAAAFFCLTPFPGTEIYKFIQQTAPEKLKKINYNDYEYTKSYANFTAISDKKLLYYQRFINRKFYLNSYRLISLFRFLGHWYLLPVYIPRLAYRITKGLFSK
jgi:anaerobic magnesium-protoporphyrin IX monomethyl ester cyclase